MSRVLQPDIFTGRAFPVCPTCGEPEREPHRHLSADVAVLAEMLLAEMARRPDRREPAAPREYMTVRQLSEHSGFSVRTLQEWARDPADPLPAVSLGGGKLVFRRSAYDSWFERRERARAGAVGGAVRGILERGRR